MANQIRLKRASGSDPGASDLVTGEVAIRTDTGKIFTKKDDNSVVELGVGISDVVEDTSPQLGGNLDTNNKQILCGDSNSGNSFSNRIKIGAGEDLQLLHDGTDSLIINATNEFKIRGNSLKLQDYSNGHDYITCAQDGAVELYHDNSKKLETASFGTNFLDDFGANDSIKLLLGNGSDLQIYHDGSNSIIDNNTGDLVIRGDGDDVKILAEDDILLRDNDDSTNFIHCVNGGSVDLYHNGSKKFETTSSGVSITGTLGSDDITITGTQPAISFIDDGANPDYKLYNNNGVLRLYDITNAADRLVVNTDGHIDVKGNLDCEAGVDVTGNITVSGTVDGRDVAADGTKLDGIESGATADQSASEILTLIKTVDGAGSGLDADTLDGATSSFFQNADNLSSGTVPQARLSASSIVALIADQTIAPSTIDMEDNEKIKLGASDDLSIFHDGSHSRIHDSGTGDLRISGSAVHIQNAAQSENMLKCFQDGAVELYHDNTKRLETNGSGINVTGNIQLNDSYKLHLGNSQDLQIYHDGSNSYIQDTGTGQLVITSNEFRLNSADNSQQMIGVQDGGSVDLYHNGSQKLQTTSSGVKVTGDVLPNANNSRDLGSSSFRWANLFVNDMHFANSVNNPNKVDGTWGDWTLQEGEDTIYMLNNRNGKQYKMNLTEV